MHVLCFVNFFVRFKVSRLLVYSIFEVNKLSNLYLVLLFGFGGNRFRVLVDGLWVETDSVLLAFCGGLDIKSFLPNKQNQHLCASLEVEGMK